MGYLPQDPRTGDLHVLARDRILSARGLDQILRDLREAEGAMASADDETRDRAMRRYGRLEAEFTARGGYAAESEAASIAVQPGPGRADPGPAAARPSPVASAAGSSWPGSCSPARRPCCWTSRPTTSTPTRSSGCATTSQAYKGGLVIISHDVELLDTVVNRVFHLDANRAELDIYNVGLEGLPAAARDRRARAASGSGTTPRRRPARCWPRPTRCGPRPPRPSPRRTWPAGPSGCWPGSRASGSPTRWPSCASPSPSPCGKTPLTARGLSRSYGSLEIFTDVDLAIDRGSRVVVLGLNGAGKTTLLRILAGIDTPDTGEVGPGHGLKLGYYAQEHETLDVARTVLENMKSAAPELGETDVRKVLGSFLFSGDDVDKPAGVLSGGEKTRLSLAMLVVSSAPTCCCSTSRPTTSTRPPARRCSARCGPTRVRSSWSPTTRAPSRRWSPSGCCCCPTASRTTSARTTSTSSRWPDR